MKDIIKKISWRWILPLILYVVAFDLVNMVPSWKALLAFILVTVGSWIQNGDIELNYGEFS